MISDRRVGRKPFISICFIQDFIVDIPISGSRQGGLGDVGKFAAMHAAAKGSEQLRFRTVAVSEVRVVNFANKNTGVNLI